MVPYRNIIIQGNDRSDPTDDSPLECDSSVSGWTKVPCPGTFLTGFGGHTIIMGKAIGNLRGVEFKRMGMTNIMGRYPVHYHHQDPSAGAQSEVTDCSVHRSYFRAITLHNAFHVKVVSNVVFDISGHAFYLGEWRKQSYRDIHDIYFYLLFSSQTTFSIFALFFLAESGVEEQNRCVNLFFSFSWVNNLSH